MGRQRPLWAPFEQCMEREAAGVYTGYYFACRMVVSEADVDAEGCSAHASRHWDNFYKNNADKFFRDRHYLDQEFPELASYPYNVLEVRCGPSLSRWTNLKWLSVKLQWTWLLHHVLQRMTSTRCAQVGCSNSHPAMFPAAQPQAGCCLTLLFSLFMHAKDLAALPLICCSPAHLLLTNACQPSACVKAHPIPAGGLRSRQHCLSPSGSQSSAVRLCL